MNKSKEINKILISFMLIFSLVACSKDKEVVDYIRIEDLDIIYTHSIIGAEFVYAYDKSASCGENKYPSSIFKLIEPGKYKSHISYIDGIEPYALIWTDDTVTLFHDGGATQYDLNDSKNVRRSALISGEPNNKILGYDSEWIYISRIMNFQSSWYTKYRLSTNLLIYEEVGNSFELPAQLKYPLSIIPKYGGGCYRG